MRKYNLASSVIKKIANLAVQENGEDAVSEEVSLMANLFELQSKYSDLYTFLKDGGWFSKADYWMKYGSASESAVNKAKDVLVNGNRTLPAYVNEHDCFSDILSITNEGQTANVRDRTKYKKDVTIIKNRYNSTYIFYCFPSSTSDPFGYTAGAYKKITGSDSFTAGKGTKANMNDVSKVIDIALDEVGYLEKKNANYLDSKTANAGSANYTKYWRDLKPSYQGEPWCDCFVSWCFKKAYEDETANNLLCGGLDSFYTPDSAQCFKIKGQWYTKPQKGDVIYFKNSDRIYHTGIVYNVTGATVYTVEGNTSGGVGVESNGGAVCKKSYSIANGKIAGYGRPKYTGSSEDYDTTGKSLNETVKWNGVVIATSLNVRKWAGTSNPTVSFSPLQSGSVVGVCDTIKSDSGEDWYYILYQKKHGFVSAKYITKN